MTHFICEMCQKIKAVWEADWITATGFLCAECRKAKATTKGE